MVSTLKVRVLSLIKCQLCMHEQYVWQLAFSISHKTYIYNSIVICNSQ